MRKALWLAASLLVVIALLAGGCAGPAPSPTPFPPPITQPPPAPTGAPIKPPPKLTESEKARVIEIALSTPEAVQWKEKESKYRTTLAWVAIVWRNSEAGEIRYLPFDRPETNPNYGLVPQEAVWYPGVVLHFGEPSRWVIQVAVDLTKGKAVDVMSSPDLSSPGRFPIPPPK